FGHGRRDVAAVEAIVQAEADGVDVEVGLQAADHAGSEHVRTAEGQILIFDLRGPGIEHHPLEAATDDPARQRRRLAEFKAGNAEIDRNLVLAPGPATGGVEHGGVEGVAGTSAYRAEGVERGRNGGAEEGLRAVDTAAGHIGLDAEDPRAARSLPVEADL